MEDATIVGIGYEGPEESLRCHLGNYPSLDGVIPYKIASDGSRVEFTEEELNELEIISSDLNPAKPGTYHHVMGWQGLELSIPLTVMEPLSVKAVKYSGTTCVAGLKTNVSVQQFDVEYEDGIDSLSRGFTVNNVNTTEIGTVDVVVDFYGYTDTITVTVIGIGDFEENIGTPNLEDVTAKYDKDTETLYVTGTGNFKALTAAGVEALYVKAKRMVFGEGLTAIPSNFAYNFTNIESLSFPSTLKTIDNVSFSGTFLGTELDFPGNITTIGAANFTNCPNLTKLTLGEGIELINVRNFSTCPNLKSAVFPKSLKTLPSGSDSDTVFEEVTIGGEDVSINSSGVNIPNCKKLRIRGGTVEYSGCSNLKNLKALTLEGAVKFNNTSQFANSSNLEDITIEDGITEIPNACLQTTKLKSLSLANTIKTIGSDNFKGSDTITSLDIPESIVSIGSACFNDFSQLKEITFHEGLETLSRNTFNNCPNVKNLVLPSTLKTIYYSFTTGTLDSVVMGGKDAVFSSTFYIENCKDLTIRAGVVTNDLSGGYFEKITLESGVTFSGDSQFNGCMSLSTIVLQEGILEIPKNCFSGDSKITEINIPDSVTKIGGSAFGGTGITKAVISKNSNLKEIGTNAFMGAPLTEIYIPAGVKTIGTNAFSGPVATNVTIDQKEGSISGSPWGARGTITWLIRATRLEVTHMPDKIRYLIGEAFDNTGLVITAYYNDNTSEQVTGYTLSSPDMSAYGSKTVTVTFDEKTVDFSILVVDISGIEVKTMPTKIEYPKGDVFDTTGLSILVKYTDGTSETITTGFEVSGFDSNSVGEKTITVTYKTHTTTFKVTIYELSGIRITSFPSKVYYKIGEAFDPSGLTVAEVRQDGTEKEITDYDISGFDSSTAGSKTITVSYNATVNGVSKFIGSDSFQIKVTNDGKNPFDGSSSGGSGGGSGEVEEEKTEPIEVTVHWINGEFADLTNENIDQNTFTLQESICSEQYFIFGGCVCNQITFQAHHDQFNGTSEEFYPSGKIEVYIERKGTKIKIFTGEIDSAERKANSLTRNFIAYDYLYKLRNTDIARWYKNQTTDKKKKLTQKQFRDKLFEFLGIEQVSTKLHWDDTYVPDTNNSNEMNVVNILKDLCLQNDRFGWMNRDGKFEYLKLRQNSYRYGQTTDNQNIYKYYNNEEIHLDTFKSFTAKEGRIWFPNVIFCDPDPNRAFGFTQGDYTAQEAYDNNVYYNRNSFFVGNEDWLNYVWNADEYGGISRTEPIMKICYGVFVNQDLRKYYRAQGYTAEVQGNPLNMVGQAVELYYKKQIQHDDQEPTELQWYVHSYIMSRTLKIGVTDMIDTYSANNAPFNSNSQQLGKYTPEISGTVNLTRSEMPTISYAEFTDGSDSEFSPAMIDDFTDGSGGSGSTSDQLKKAQLRCVKRIKKADYDALVAAGTDRTDTLYFTFKEG